MEYMAAQMDRQIDGAISENERLSNELHEAHALNVALLDALIELEAMADRYRPPGYPIPDAHLRHLTLQSALPSAAAEHRLNRPAA